MNYEWLNSVRNAESGFELERLPAMELKNNELSDRLIGSPEKDMENWHRQSELMSCSICCQEMIAEQLLNRDFSEKEMIQYAKERGWYDSESGTTMKDTGKLLEALGISVERRVNMDVNDLSRELSQNNKLICCVNDRILDDPEYARIPGNSANHAVEVIGIDAKDPSDVRVILNDPGVKNGKGLRVPMDTFVKAWNTSNNYTIVARKGVAI